MYIFGVELYYDYLYFYIFFDFTLPYDFYFNIPTTVNKQKYLRNLQGNEKIEVLLYLYNYIEESKIGIFEGYLSEYIDDINEITIDFDHISDNKDNIINYSINTTFKENIDDKNYEDSLLNKININAFKVKGVITKGNNFTLILGEDIYVQREVTIQLIDTENKNNIIESKCVLSSDNDNKVPCSLGGDINGKYYMKDYFYLNKENSELISICIDKPSKNYIILENNKVVNKEDNQEFGLIPDSDSNEESTQVSTDNKLSIGVIVIIILCSFIIISVITIGTILIILIIKNNAKNGNNYNRCSASVNNNKILQAYASSANNL